MSGDSSVSSVGDTGDGRAGHPDAVALLRRAQQIVGGTRALPWSSSFRLDQKEEVLELLEEAVRRLPEEVRQARWLLREREEFLAKVRREADEILEAARVRAERMVQRTEIARSAQATARSTVEHAREEARRLRHEAEDYCDQKLAAFEIVLERTLKTVAAGREKLRVTPLPTPDAGRGAEPPDDHPHDRGSPEDGTTFFDQDRV